MAVISQVQMWILAGFLGLTRKFFFELTGGPVAAIISQDDSGGFCASQIVNVPTDGYKKDRLSATAGLLDFRRRENDEKDLCFCL